MKDKITQATDIINKDGSSTDEKVVAFLDYNKNDTTNKPYINRTRWNDINSLRLSDGEQISDYLLGERETCFDTQHGSILLRKKVREKGKRKKVIVNILKDSIVSFYRVDGNVLLITAHFTDKDESRRPVIEKNMSYFTVVMPTSDPQKLIQLERFDVNSQYMHQNSLDCLNKSDDELALFKKYYGIIVTPPHFHFNNPDYQDCLAINVDNLIMYLKDLITAEKGNILNQYSIGLPFLDYKLSKNIDSMSKDDLNKNLKLKIKDILKNIKDDNDFNKLHILLDSGAQIKNGIFTYLIKVILLSAREKINKIEKIFKKDDKNCLKLNNIQIDRKDWKQKNFSEKLYEIALIIIDRDDIENISEESKLDKNSDENESD